MSNLKLVAIILDLIVVAVGGIVMSPGFFWYEVLEDIEVRCIYVQTLIKVAPLYCVQGITLKCIKCWISRFEDLGSVEYSFIAITPGSTLIQNGSSCYGQIRTVWKTFISVYQKHLEYAGWIPQCGVRPLQKKGKLNMTLNFTC